MTVLPATALQVTMAALTWYVCVCVCTSSLMLLLQMGAKFSDFSLIHNLST